MRLEAEVVVVRMGMEDEDSDELAAAALSCAVEANRSL